jgi:hypothetical protein
LFSKTFGTFISEHQTESLNHLWNFLAKLVQQCLSYF